MLRWRTDFSRHARVHPPPSSVPPDARAPPEGPNLRRRFLPRPRPSRLGLEAGCRWLRLGSSPVSAPLLGPAGVQQRSRTTPGGDVAIGEEHVKIVELDMGEPAWLGWSSCSAAATESRERHLAECYHGCAGKCSPTSLYAAFGAELSSQHAYSRHFKDVFACELAVMMRSSLYVLSPGASGNGYGAVPRYMVNTESSRPMELS